MGVKYGPTVENINLIVEKAAGKADGVWSFRNMEYRVRNGRFTHFAYNGQIFERAGNFNVAIGTYTGTYIAGRQKLRQITD